jgi:hypothetical protein
MDGTSQSQVEHTPVASDLSAAHYLTLGISDVLDRLASSETATMSSVEAPQASHLDLVRD